MKTILLSSLLLVGCATAVDQKPRDPIIMPGEKIPVIVREKCKVDIPEEPVWLVDSVALDATPFEKSKAILAEIEQRRDYINKLKAASIKCS